MSQLKETKFVYTHESGVQTQTQEIIVDAIINLDNICVVLPGRKPGLLTVVMSDKTRYTLQDDVKSFLKRDKDK